MLARSCRGPCIAGPTNDAHTAVLCVSYSLQPKPCETCCREVNTIHEKSVSITELADGSIEVSYRNSTVTLLGPATESCKNGSLLYSVLGALSEQTIPSLNDWSSYHDRGIPVRQTSRPFAQVAGMVMMFAFVLVITLAFVACCRGRRHQQGTRQVMLGGNLSFAQKGPESGPPPPPPPTVLHYQQLPGVFKP